MESILEKRLLKKLEVKEIFTRTGTVEVATDPEPRAKSWRAHAGISVPAVAEKPVKVHITGRHCRQVKGTTVLSLAFAIPARAGIACIYSPHREPRLVLSQSDASR